MKFIFFISHGLHLRNYGDLVRALAGAGHDVVLAKTSTKEIDDTVFRRIGEEEARVTTALAPPRAGRWWATNDPLRAVRDYLRYFGPVYADAPKLFARAARRIPRLVRATLEGGRLGRIKHVRHTLDALLRAVEQATRPDPALVAWIKAQAPDAVLITPLIDFDYYQLDALKAAAALGIPTAHLVASWDNLTNKGGILLPPDRVVVWNAQQKREAETLHGIPADRVVVTGAQLFDHWFEMTPSCSREAFLTHMGNLDPACPLVLYLCSSSFICEDEVASVRQWILALRRSGDPILSSANVLVRPHPAHAQQWSGVDFLDLAPVTIWPRGGEVPMDAARKQSYFDSLYHAAAVVGVNTSGFLEAAIVGRRTLILRTPQSTPTQEGTLHVRYLLGDGFLLHADDMPTHFAQLGRVLRGHDAADLPLQRFVRHFLRPHGLDHSALPRVVEAVEQLARIGRTRPAQSRWWMWVVRAAAAPLALVVAPQYRAVLARRHNRMG